jgi:para-aminobenzoate synthetase/4-amino-4-deoxychorismate lyase
VSVSGREVITGSGGGIVWDSDAREEYRECLLKTRYLGAESSDNDEPIQLIESMICNGDIALIDRHLRRLEGSAEALEFKFDRRVIVDSIDDHIGTLDRDLRFKVRLLLAANGTCSVTSESISAGSAEESSHTSASSVSSRRALRLGIASVTVHSGNPFLKHKTSFRSTFENARRTALENGLDEVLFLNEDQQITEGTITNVFLRHGDLWQTPAATCGLLPGIGREIELESIRRPEEASLALNDLRSADEIILTNAVRGRMRAEFVE